MVSDVPTHAALTRAGADQLAERWRPSAARATRASWARSSGEGGQRDDFENIAIGGGLTDTLTATVQQ